MWEGGSCAIERMARETGLEPAASAVTGRRSNQLSYSRGCRNPKGTGPQREQGLKARLSLVKVIANPLVLQALLRFRCKKWLIFRPIGLRRPRQDSFKA